MAIKSHAFGRVTLTKEDAAKFARQVKFGRSSASAKSTVERGAAMNTIFKSSGKVVVRAVRREKESMTG